MGDYGTDKIFVVLVHRCFQETTCVPLWAPGNCSLICGLKEEVFHGKRRFILQQFVVDGKLQSGAGSLAQADAVLAGAEDRIVEWKDHPDLHHSHYMLREASLKRGLTDHCWPHSEDLVVVILWWTWKVKPKAMCGHHQKSWGQEW